MYTVIYVCIHEQLVCVQYVQVMYQPSHDTTPPAINKATIVHLFYNDPSFPTMI